MSFGKTIKRLRRERDMTQEQLAEILSISPQAVSRWETDMTMPDISLIAPLCNLFGVTADQLLEIDSTRRRDKVRQICQEAHQYSDRGYLEKAREILEDGLSQYPDDLDIISDLMFVTSFQAHGTGKEKYRDEAIRLGEKILAQSTNDEQRHGAIQTLCFAYRNAGRMEEAERLAMTMPVIAVSRELLLSHIYTGTEVYRAKQNAIMSMIQHLSNQLSFLQTKLDSGEMAYTPEECAALRDKDIAFLHLLFENGDFGFYHTDLHHNHCEQAIYYAGKNEKGKALEHLALAAKHAIKFITSAGEESTSLVLRGMEGGTWSTTRSDNNAMRLLNRMTLAVFDGIRDEEEFIRIKEELSQYAGEWGVGS